MNKQRGYLTEFAWVVIAIVVLAGIIASGIVEMLR